MIEQMSPITRRIVAIGLAILLLLLIVQLLLVPLIGAIGEQRDELASLRARRARLTATAHRFMPDSSTMPLGLTIVATDQTAAAKRLQALLAGSARIAGVGVTVGAAQPSPASPRLLGCEIVGTGSEAGLATFINLVEHGSPAIRFSRWRLTSGDASSGMRLEAQAIAAWQPAS